MAQGTHTILSNQMVQSHLLSCFVCGTHLRVEVKETVVFKPQQQHLILLYILLHQRPG